jgi:6-phosphogluconolactonase
MAVLATACGHSIYSLGTDSPIPTATASSGTGGFLYAGNFAAGTISEYQRSQRSGALKLIGRAASGAAMGPAGLTTDPTGNFLYVANPADGLHQFQINRSSGRLTPLTPKRGLVSAGDEPQWVAISSGANGTFAYAANFGDGSISQYVVGTDGKLQTQGAVSSGLLTNPFGAVATSGFLYVADNTNGTIVSFPINSDGTLAAAGASATKSSLQKVRNPVVVILDPTQSFLYVSDQATGYISVFAISGGPLSGLLQSVPSIAAGGAIGLAIASLSNGNEFLYVANPTANSVSVYTVRPSGKLTAISVAANSLRFPTGLVVGTEGSGAILYVANQTGGSVMRFKIDAGSGLLRAPVTVATGSGPQFLAIPAS